MAFRAVARECGYDFRLLDEVMRINEEQRQRFLAQGSQCAVDAARQTAGGAWPGIQRRHRRHPRIASAAAGAVVAAGRRTITAYDPAAMERAREVLGSKIEFGLVPYEAAHDADALLILTEWEEFANLDLNRTAAGACATRS